MSLNLSHVWDTEEVGDLISWNKLLKAGIQAREEKAWLVRISAKPKLRVYCRIKSSLRQEEYLRQVSLVQRKFLTRMREGTNNLRVETGRHLKEPLEARTCRICVQNVVEDETHFLLHCYVFERERTRLFRQIAAETGYSLEVMRGNDDWLIDVLIGHGLKSPEVRLHITRAVCRYLVRTLAKRERILSNRR